MIPAREAEPAAVEVGRLGPSPRLAAAAAGTLVLNCAAVLLNLALLLVFTRLLGAREFGAYASAMAWASVVTAIGMLGLSPLIVRQVAAYETTAAWGLLRGLLTWANRAVMIGSLAALAAVAAAGTVAYAGRQELWRPFALALVLGPLLALTSVRQAAMQGLGRVVLGRLPETTLAPSAALAVSAVLWLALRGRFGASWAVGAQIAGTIVAFALGAALLRRVLPRAARHARRERDVAYWRRSGLPLVLLTALLAANAQAGTILLGVLGSAADAGIFNVASRTTMLISFVMLAASYPLMPVVARLHVAGDVAGLQRLVLRTARLVLLFALPTALALVVFAPLILRLFQGDFESGATAMRILAVGELVNVLTGYGGLVLVMSGHETDLARSVGAGAVVNLVLSAALIPLLGVEGAALGASVGMVCANVLMTVRAWRRLRVWAAVIPAPSFLLHHRVRG